MNQPKILPGQAVAIYDGNKKVYRIVTGVDIDTITVSELRAINGVAALWDRHANIGGEGNELEGFVYSFVPIEEKVLLHYMDATKEAFPYGQITGPVETDTGISLNCPFFE